MRKDKEEDDLLYVFGWQRLIPEWLIGQLFKRSLWSSWGTVKAT